jgi:hypothetical protein
VRGPITGNRKGEDVTKTTIDDHIAAIVEKIRFYESELDAEISKSRAKLRFGMEKGEAVFEGEILRRHRELRTGLRRYLIASNPLAILTAPFIYALIVPLALLDIFVTVYQVVCFPVYGIPRVCRSKYMVFDRRHLAYLNVVEKLNCAFCSYATGLISYVGEISSRTEPYWCPIKHARRLQGYHARYRNFVDYGDADAYREEWEELRNKVQKPPEEPHP